MKRNPARVLAVGSTLIGILACLRAAADPNVVVSAAANPEYTARKYGDGTTTPETYVVMQGNYFEGYTVDRSVDRVPFRRIAEIFAPELAKRNYWPARTTQEADLLIVVHWGTTNPPPSNQELRAQTSVLPSYVADTELNIQSRYYGAPNDIASVMMGELNGEVVNVRRFAALEIGTDQLANKSRYERIALLLGYARPELRQLMTIPVEWNSFQTNLREERYFIILKAYNLHASTPAERSRAIWTVWLNMSSPGNSFQTALDRMSAVAADYVGRTTDRVETVGEPREGKVTIGPVVTHGEAK